MSIKYSEAIKYCIYCGAKYDLAINGNKFQCTSCQKPFYINPIFGAGAFCFNDKGETLMIRRAKDPHKGSLDVPAGFVDWSDDSLETALQRELKEELSIEVTDIKYLCSAYTEYDYAGIIKNNIGTFFTCRIISSSITNDTKEVQGFEFYKPDDIDINQIEFTNTKVALKKLRGF